MHRQLLRQEPEVIAVIARTEYVWRAWQKEHDFYDTDKIKWKYVYGKYSIMGIRFTALFLVGNYWTTKDFGLLSRLVQENIERYGGKKIRTFSTAEMQKGKYKYVVLS